MADLRFDTYEKERIIYTLKRQGIEISKKKKPKLLTQTV